MFRRLLAAFALVGMIAAPAAARPEVWTPWYSLEDTYKNRIDVRFNHTRGGNIKYQFRNRYIDMVAIQYRVVRNNGEFIKDGTTAIARGGTSYASEGLVEGEKNVWITITGLRKAGTGDELPRFD